MKVCVRYESGKRDEFDTITFCCNEPFKKQGVNVLTEFVLRLDQLDERHGLLLDVFWHPATEDNQTEHDDDTGADIPVLQRQRGWRMCLVGREEIDTISEIAVDGVKAAWRQGGEIIIADKFFSQEVLCYSDASTTSINRRALALFEYLKKAHPDIPEEVVAYMMGYTLPSIDHIRGEEFAASEFNQKCDIEGGDTAKTN